MEDDDGGNNARRRPLDGVEDAIRELQRRGIKVALTTGARASCSTLWSARMMSRPASRRRA
jgi:phosphoglycolate phosphatase-like HAD superfamily hydrolase